MDHSKEDIDKIPHGLYCYTPIGEGHNEAGMPVLKIKLCPFYVRKEINGVSTPYCEFLKKGGTPSPEHKESDADMEKLIEHFGSVEKVWEELPLDLLWDQCKECCENDD